MASTAYKSYKWLIETLEEELIHGYTLETLARKYFSYIHSSKSSKGVPSLKRTTFYNWRTQIYKQFGLIIDTPKYDNYYVLTNPQLLDENKTLRDVIKQLADDEEIGYQPATLIFSKRGRKPKNTAAAANQSMGFVSIGGVDNEYDAQMGYEYSDEPEMLSLVRFAMTIGEGLVIEYGKMSKTHKPSDIFILEPQQIVNINGQWYVIGNICSNEDRDKRCIGIYNIDNIRLYDGEEDIVPTRYEVKEGFDIIQLLDPECVALNKDKVVSLYLNDMSNKLENHPIHSTQMLVNQRALGGTYQVYTKLNYDFIIPYLSYGDEVRVYCPYKDFPKTEIEISEDDVKLLNKLKSKELHI